MTNKTSSPSLIEWQFRRAMKNVCYRKDHVEQKTGESKSTAQVAPFVQRSAVEQKSSGLKPERIRVFSIGIRLSQSERDSVVQQAQKARLTISEYVRASILGAGYVSAIDPVQRQFLLDVSRELGRQGTNLNQIAKQLNAGFISAEQGETILGLLARSLLNAHQDVRQALLVGRSME